MLPVRLYVAKAWLYSRPNASPTKSFWRGWLGGHNNAVKAGLVYKPEEYLYKAVQQIM